MLFLEFYVVSLQKWRSMWTFPTMYSSGALILVSVTGKKLLLPPHFFWSYCLSGHCEIAQFHLRGLVLNRSLILHAVLEVLIMDLWGWGPLWGGELSKALLQRLPTALWRQGRKLTMLSLHYQPKMLRRNTCATYHHTGTLPWTGSHCVHLSQLEVKNL